MAVNIVEIGVEACKDKDSAIGQLAVDVLNQCQAIAARHNEVAEQQMGTELAGAGKTVVGRVAGARVKSILLEDHVERVSNHGVVVDDENSLGG